MTIVGTPVRAALQPGRGPRHRAQGATSCAPALAGLKGTVVEVGAGDGANFALYPDEVERIVAVEPEPFLRERAPATPTSGWSCATRSPTDLPVADGEADAVVFSLVLCSVDQDARARRGTAGAAPGRRAALPRARAGARAGGEPQGRSGCSTPRCGRGCSVAATAGATRPAPSSDAGFTVTELERFTFPEGARGPAAAVVIGTARGRLSCTRRSDPETRRGPRPLR